MNEREPISTIPHGVAVIRDALKTLPDTPGVYRMLGKDGEVLYIGKAKALKRRVASYTKTEGLSVRIQRMVALTCSMEFVHTGTEVEALLLESNLIKKLGPRFNILLRDDKSFPYILITGDHDFPLVTKHRGARRRKGEYFGPFAGAGDVNRTIAILQRIFLLRNCSDTNFAGRERPCLQYHIKRCTAPCVGRVSRNEYAAQVEQARDFLEGRGGDLQKQFSKSMQDASTAQDYERAAEYRDRIRALSAIQSHQEINFEGVIADADVIAVAREGGQIGVQVFFFRAGRNYGNRSYFPRHDREEAEGDVLAAFMAQFYENKPVPAEILASHVPAQKALLEEAFTLRAARRVRILRPERGPRRKLLDFVARNAREALRRHLAQKAGEAELLQGVATLFGMEEAPARIEVYDNSHISGTNMVGAMIVAGPGGFDKKSYRRFNIREADAADDYGMMREVLERRFRKALKEEGVGGPGWPDLLMIDGGQGQYSAARGVIEDLGIADAVTLVSIAKGADRHAGREKFYTGERKSFQLSEGDPVLHYLQRLRDEAHRFAIGGHRAKRSRQIGSSLLDEVPGIGPGRKKALLHHFGSARAVAEAGVQDLEKVAGISRAVARRIYDHFHA